MHGHNTKRTHASPTSSPSARERSKSGGESPGDRGLFRYGEMGQERSFTPPRMSGEQNGSESFYSLSQALIQGINKIANNSNNRSGVINNNIIEEFNPVDKDIREWLNAVDEFSQINNWSDQITCHLALSKLRGPAETWYRGLPTRLFTWTEWKELLLENFIPKRDLYSDMKKMLSCVPKPNQSLYEYAFNKLSLINRMKIPLSDADKVNLIMGDIKNNQIRFSVETSEITNPAKLARYLKIFDGKNAFDNAFQNVQPSTSSASLNPFELSSKNQFKMSNKNKYSSKHSQKNSSRCFICYEKGHFKDQCPKNKQKNTCKELVNYHNA